MASMPSTPGITRSISTTSGGSSRRRPPPPRRRRRRRRPRCLPAARGRCAGPGARRRGHPRSGRESSPGHLQPDRCSGTRSRLDAEAATERARPLLHRREPEPPRTQRARTRAQPTPSSSTSSAAARRLREPDSDGPRRSGAVRERLLRDPNTSWRARARDLVPPESSARSGDARAAAPRRLRSAGPRPSVSTSAGRSWKTSERSSPTASWASLAQPVDLLAGPAVALEQHPAERAASTIPNSFWTTESEVAGQPVALFDRAGSRLRS